MIRTCNLGNPFVELLFSFQDVYSFQGGNTAGGFLHPLETFHYIPSVFSTGLHHPGFVIPDRQTNY